MKTTGYGMKGGVSKISRKERTENTLVREREKRKRWTETLNL